MYDAYVMIFQADHIWGLHETMDYAIWELKGKYSSKYHFRVLVM